MKFSNDKHDHYRIGSVYLRGDKLIYITGGAYIGGYNRISNHFRWREVNSDGTLSKEEFGGYGDTSVKPAICSIDIRVKAK